MKPLDGVQVAGLAGGAFDVPPRTRKLLLVAGATGLVIVVTMSLVGRTDASLPVDKLLHFSGYFVLSVVFVLGLRPRLFVPTLVALAAVGLGVEYLQPRNGRTFDWSDAAANGLGVAIGGGVGLLARAGFAYVRKELAAADARRRLVHYRVGDVILRQGEPAREFFIVARGEVTFSRVADGGTADLGRAGPGQAIGVLGVLRGEPQYSTVRAMTKVSLVRVSLNDLFESVGGRQQPVAAVLASMAEAIHSLGDRLARSECGAATEIDSSSNIEGPAPPLSGKVS